VRVGFTWRLTPPSPALRAPSPGGRGSLVPPGRLPSSTLQAA
jgi:hypothetical protein